MKSFTVGWRGSSPQSLHDYNNGPAGTADRVLGTSPFEKDEIDTIKIFANLFSHHYLQSTIANVIYLLSIIHENMYMVGVDRSSSDFNSVSVCISSMRTARM